MLIPATDSRGGIGNALIITRHTVVNATHTDIITATDSWFNNVANVSPTLRAATMNTQVPPARGSSTTASTGENTFMLPQPGIMGAGRAFSLSRVEAEEYFATNADRAATGTHNRWWPRASPSISGINTTNFIGEGGHASTSGGNISESSSLGVRPAVWVSVN